LYKTQVNNFPKHFLFNDVILSVGSDWKSEANLLIYDWENSWIYETEEYGYTFYYKEYYCVEPISQNYNFVFRINQEDNNYTYGWINVSIENLVPTINYFAIEK
jgi:hypothetical protein